MSNANYEQQRLQEIKDNYEAALKELDDLYGGQIEDARELYGQMQEAAESAAKQQTQLAQEQAQLAVDQLKQEKLQHEQDYLKEQSAAYADYKEETKPGGVREEALAQIGMEDTGYAETSRVAMYNAYQNRVAAARSGFQAALAQYDLGIAQAQAQNSALLAQIALETLERQLQLSLESFRFESQMELEQYRQKQGLQKDFLQRYEKQLEKVQKSQGGKGPAASVKEDQEGKTGSALSGAVLGANQVAQNKPETIFDVLNLGLALKDENAILNMVEEGRKTFFTGKK